MVKIAPPNAGGLGSIFGQETGSCMPQLRPGVAKLKKKKKKVLSNDNDNYQFGTLL